MIVDEDSDSSTPLPSHSFCIIPWIHLNTHPNGDVMHCCITDKSGVVGSLKQDTLADIWNNDKMKALRLQLLAGDKPYSCRKCYEQEDNSIRSFRNSANWLFDHHIDQAQGWTNSDGSIDDMRLRYWDFRFSNLCNMKCRMCGHHASSAWHGDMIDLYGPGSVSKDVVIRTVDNSVDDLYTILDQQIDNVEEIYFAGGEPLIMDEHYYILEKLIKQGRKDVKIRYNTNLLKIRYKNWDNLDLWSNFDQIDIMASLDAMGARGEYIRSGTVWHSIDENIRRLIASPNVTFHVQPTIQVLNILHLPDFVDYLFDCGLDSRLLHLNNVLTSPRQYHINTLDDDYKAQVAASFSDHVGRISNPHTAAFLRQSYDAIISYMNTKSDRSAAERADIHRSFLKQTTGLDKLRSEDFLETFPELAAHYNKKIA